MNTHLPLEPELRFLTFFETARLRPAEPAWMQVIRGVRASAVAYVTFSDLRPIDRIGDYADSSLSHDSVGGRAGARRHRSF